MIQKNKYYVYVLYSEVHKRIYIGHCKDLKMRFEQHNKGRVPSTKPYIPYMLIYFEVLESKSEVVLREKHLKTSTGRRFVKTFIK